MPDKVQGYPLRPVRIVVGTTPGGALDALARLIAQRFNAHYGQNAIVDNRSGAGTQLGMDVVAAAQPDGHTLLCASETVLLLGAQKRTRYDVLKTFTPVSWLTTTAYVLIVNPVVPAANVKEFIAYAKARPGEVRYGTPGVGATQHLIWERFGGLTGVQFAHVPYKAGALATLDVVSGQIQTTMTTLGNAIGPIKSNRVRPLAVTGLKRLQAMPELPTIAESALPGFEAVSGGDIRVGGKPIAGPAADRGVVFQGDDSLYGWLTALGNVEFGLRMRGIGRAEREQKARHYLELFAPYSDDFSGCDGIWAFLDDAIDWPAALSSLASIAP